MSRVIAAPLLDAPTTRPARPRLRVADLLRRQGALLMLVLACVFATIRYDTFLTPENLFNVVRQNSMVGLMALGMTVVILSGGIDLSLGALLAIGGVVGASLTDRGAALAVP